MKGQTQALTAVLITTVTIGAIAAAYTWGTPLLEKHQDQNEIQELEAQVFNLHSAVEDVARAGSGNVRTVSLELGTGRVTVEEDQDYIEIETDAPTQIYPESWTLINGNSLQNISVGAGNYGIKGQNQPGVVMARGTGGTVTYRVEFRNLRSGERLEKIDLRQFESSTERGDVEVTVSNTGTESETVDIDSSTFNRDRTVVEVNLR